MYRFNLINLIGLIVIIFLQAVGVQGQVPTYDGPFFSGAYSMPLLDEIEKSDDLKVVDLTGNNIPELVITSQQSSQIVFWKDFQPSDTYREIYLYPIQSPEIIKADQMDGDGRIDLIAAHRTSSPNPQQSVTILYHLNDNLASDSFVPQKIFGQDTGSAQLPRIAIGDVDEDGDRDVLVNFIAFKAGETSNIYLLRNTGERTFVQEETGITGYGSEEMLFRDLDLDGHLDLILLLSSLNTQPGIRIYEGDGSGTFQFQPPQINFASPLNAELVDVDGNGLPDLIIHDSVIGGEANIHLYYQAAPFQFSAEETRFVGVFSWDMKVEDAMGNGYKEVFVSGVPKLGSQTPHIYMFKFIDGHFFGPIEFSTIITPSRIELLDLDGDDLKEIILLENKFLPNQGNKVGIVPQVTPTPTPTNTPTPTPTNIPTDSLRCFLKPVKVLSPSPVIPS